MGTMEHIFKFDIFSGSIDKNALWLERAEGRGWGSDGAAFDERLLGKEVLCFHVG